MPYSFGYCRGRVFALPAPYPTHCHRYSGTRQKVCSARGRESNPDVRSHTRGRANSVRGRAEDPDTQEHKWFTSSKRNPPLTRRWGYHPLSALTNPQGPHTRAKTEITLVRFLLQSTYLPGAWQSAAFSRWSYLHWMIIWPPPAVAVGTGEVASRYRSSTIWKSVRVRVKVLSLGGECGPNANVFLLFIELNKLFSWRRRLPLEALEHWPCLVRATIVAR